jgi:hypothetical protein
LAIDLSEEGDGEEVGGRVEFVADDETDFFLSEPASLERGGDDGGVVSPASDALFVGRLRKLNFIPDSILEDTEMKEDFMDCLGEASLSLRFL